MRKVERYRNNIMIDGILVHKEKMTDKDERGSNWENNWVEIEPKYYIDKSDDMIFEMWYDRTGIILDRGLNTYIKNDEIANNWSISNLKEINKESAMTKYKERLLREERLAELDAKEKQELSNYNNKNLMQRLAEFPEPSFDKEQNKNLGCNKKVLMSKEMTNDRDLFDAIASCYYRTKKPKGWEKKSYKIDIKNMIEKSEGNACSEIEAPSTKTKSDSIDAMKYNIQNNRLYMGIDFSNDEPKYKVGDILKVIGGHDREIGTLFKVKDCTTRYRAEDVELYTGLLTINEEINIHNQSILNSRMEFEKAKNKFIFRQRIESKGCNAETIKQQNNGGSSDWYLLPDNAKTLQDLIEHRNMNGAVKDMFKACYRLGIKTEDELRDLNKTAYYALREIGRVSGRKDYITIAKELIGSQAIEKE